MFSCSGELAGTSSTDPLLSQSHSMGREGRFKSCRRVQISQRFTRLRGAPRFRATPGAA
jgi:hypothetical protein